MDSTIAIETANPLLAVGAAPLSKPKVVIVYHFFAHYRQAIIYELMASHGFEFIFAGALVDPDRSIKEAVVPENYFFHAPCRRIFLGLLFQRRLIRLSLRRDISSIIFLGDVHFVMTWVAAVIARIFSKRVLFWTHGWKTQESGIKGLTRSLFYRLPHGLLLYGNRSKQIGMAKGFEAERLYVIYNSLDYQAQRTIRRSISNCELETFRKSLFMESRTPLVVCTARLTAACQFTLLLDAMDKLRAEGHIVYALLIGDGPELSSLQSLVLAKRLPVMFYGPCYKEEQLARMIMSANVTVSPGKVGLTAMHSLAYGTPVITHDNFDAQMPEYEAIIPGKTGDFFRYKNSSDLARLVKLWTLKGDIRTDQERETCYEVIEKRYNPELQRKIIERALEGMPAGDGEELV